MNDLVIAVFFVWLFQSITSAVLFAANLKTRRILMERTKDWHDGRVRKIDTLLEAIKDRLDTLGPDILPAKGAPYRTPANKGSEPIILPAHDPKVMNPAEWKPGMPCPFCLRDEHPDDPTEQAYRPVDGATAENPYLTWECLYCASQWNTGIQGQDQGLQRDGKVREIDVSGMSPDEALEAVQRERPRPVGPRLVSE
jgi:hypothetical protein